jgi:phosphohistidine phosphatase SixA
MAEHLRRKRIEPELVLCSPSRRTRQTLTRLAPALVENADVQIESKLYAASATDQGGGLAARVGPGPCEM